MPPLCWRKARKISQKAAKRAAERLFRFEPSQPIVYIKKGAAVNRKYTMGQLKRQENFGTGSQFLFPAYCKAAAVMVQYKSLLLEEKVAEQSEVG